MSTRRAKRHQWIVLRQKASRYFNRHRGSYYYVYDQHTGRWRAVGRKQIKHKHMVSVLHLTGWKLPQEKTEPSGLLQFVKTPFDPDWIPFDPEEDNHDD